MKELIFLEMGAKELLEDFNYNHFCHGSTNELFIHSFNVDMEWNKVYYKYYNTWNGS
jgi:hypothetical protein